LSQAEKYRAAEARYWVEVAGGKPDERIVHLPRLDADVRVLELGSGPPLLFIHGGPNAGSTWAPLVGALSGFRCLVVDRPGCGMSSLAQEAPKSVRRFMGDLAKPASALGSTDPQECEEGVPADRAREGHRFGSDPRGSFRVVRSASSRDADARERIRTIRACEAEGHVHAG
jgi:hypothetical protein